MKLFDKLTVFVEQLPKTLEDLNQAIHDAAKRERGEAQLASRITAEIRFPREIEDAQAASQDEQTRIQRRIARWTALAFVAAATGAGFAGWYACIAKDTERRQLRAYTVVTDLALDCRDCGDTFQTTSPTDYQNSIAYRVENTGQTPAANVNVRLTWLPIPVPHAKLPNEYLFPDPDKKPDIVSYSDMGRDKAKAGYAVLDSEGVKTFKGAVSNVITVFIYGHVDYCDVFDKPHSTAFCYTYIPHAGLSLPLCDRFNGEIPARGKCPATQ